MKKDDPFTPFRFAHLTSYSGVGSIIRDSNDFTMVVADTRYWKDRYNQQVTSPIRFIERVKMHLGVTKHLHLPPESKIDNQQLVGNYLPSMIFPGYAKCRYCGRLHHKPWYHDEKGISRELKCQNPECGKAGLEQVTWCAVSSHGDLRDVPWHFICHLDSNNKCEWDPDTVYLKISMGNKGRHIIRCHKCNAIHEFEQLNFKSRGNVQPWDNQYQSNQDDIIYTIMEINDPRVYRPERKSAIVIPPESNVDKNSVTYKLYTNSERLNKIRNETKKLKKKSLLRSSANAYRCEIEDIEKAIEEIDLIESEQKRLTTGEMYTDEFKALVAEAEFRDGVDFNTRHLTGTWKEYLSAIDNENNLKQLGNDIDLLVAVDRLRVIEVFTGFSRKANEVKDNTDDNPDVENKDNREEVVIIPSDLTGESNWLPAIELFGEGVFFTLNSTLLNDWETQPEIRHRADEIKQRFESSTVSLTNEPPVITPRFILLHTLSHLIIRELEQVAGYPAASLKERVYSSKTDNMAGILIYSAVADNAGTLGGIVQQAEPGYFLKLLEGAIKHAQWCSLDPVCAETEGKGPDLLNRAACHACCLIAEPSCEYNNMFLDRILVKGDSEKNIQPFFIKPR